MGRKMSRAAGVGLAETDYPRVSPVAGPEERGPGGAAWRRCEVRAAETRAQREGTGGGGWKPARPQRSGGSRGRPNEQCEEGRAQTPWLGEREA